MISLGPSLRLNRRRRFGCIMLGLAAFLGPTWALQQNQAPPAFRANVVLVPLNVRVVDAEGHPVTDLTAADFTVFENGVKQEIAHFSAQASSASLAPGHQAPARRTFLIVLGRGHLNALDKGIDAAIAFVRSRLTPEDRVGVLAYLRLAELTPDHEAAVRLLERFRDRHEAIEQSLVRDFKHFVGSPALPLSPETQLAIQAVFDAPGLPALHPFPGSGGGRGIEFVDANYFLRAIEYLRHVEGEKHLVFLLEKDMPVGRDGDTFIPRQAAAARATISIIRAGGVPGFRATTGRPIGELGSPGDGLESRLNRVLAEQTGGRAAVHESADESFARLARVTSHQYLLGFYPVNPPVDGEYREIKVAVNRPGVTLSYRHGYEARREVDEPQDVRRIFTEYRIQEVTSWAWPRESTRKSTPPVRGMPRWSSNIPTRLSPEVTRGESGQVVVKVQVAIDAEYVTFTRKDHQYSASLDVATFVDDAEGKVVGTTLDRIDLTFDEESLMHLRRQSIEHTAQVDLSGRPAQVRVVVYEYDTDRAGAARARIR